MTWTPDDVIKLVTVVLTGTGTLLTAIIGAYVLVLNARQKKTEERAEANSEKLTSLVAHTDGMASTMQELARREGFADAAARGVDRAATLAQGQHEGRATAVAATLPLVESKQPIPVTDDRTAVAAEESAAATKRIADAAERKR